MPKASRLEEVFMSSGIIELKSEGVMTKEVEDMMKLRLVLARKAGPHCLENMFQFSLACGHDIR